MNKLVKYLDDMGLGETIKKADETRFSFGADAKSNALYRALIPCKLRDTLGRLAFSVIASAGAPPLLGMDALEQMEARLDLNPQNRYLEIPAMKIRFPLIKHRSGHVLLNIAKSEVFDVDVLSKCPKCSKCVNAQVTSLSTKTSADHGRFPRRRLPRRVGTVRNGSAPRLRRVYDDTGRRAPGDDGAATPSMASRRRQQPAVFTGKCTASGGGTSAIGVAGYVMQAGTSAIVFATFS